jgi:hypothetical protein
MFREGFDYYISGEWTKSRDIYKQVEEVKGMIDYPTRNLLSIMAETNY